MSVTSSPSAWVKAQSWILPRLQDVVFVAVFTLVVLLGPRILNVDGDLGRHLTIGEHILQTRSIPVRDVFSHTMLGQPLTPHEWLSEVAFAAAFRALGLDGVVLLCALLLAATFGLVFRFASRRSGLPLTCLVLTLLAAAASSLHWLARPHLFTLLLVVVWTEGLEAIRRGERAAWWRLPLMMLLWVNLHGAFLFGFLIWLAYSAGWVWRTRIVPSGVPVQGEGRQLLLAGGLSLAATLVNPVGLRLWATSIGYVGNAYLTGHTAEYLSPNFHDVSTWPFLLLIIISFWVAASGRAQLGIESILLLLGWMGLGLYSVRHVPVFAVLGVPILALALRSTFERAGGARAWLQRERLMGELEARLRGHGSPVLVVTGVILALAIGVRLTPVPGGNSFSPRVFPVQAVDWLAANPRDGNVFNHFPWGGYLLFRLWPDVRVFIDGQTDFYGEAVTREYEQVITLADGWDTFLDKYAVTWAIVPAHSKLAAALGSELGWAEAYADDTAVILERSE